MCETRDLGMRWPQWHTLVFSNEITVDMRYMCPKDVIKMLVPRARSGGKFWRPSESEQKAKTSKQEWKWQRGLVVHPLSESQWNRGNFRMRIWKSEKHRSWVFQQKVSRAALPLTAPCWVPREKTESMWLGSGAVGL